MAQLAFLGLGVMGFPMAGHLATRGGHSLTVYNRTKSKADAWTAKFGGTPKGGIKRLTVSDEDKKVRDWFKAECEKLGCRVQVDSVGNMFATRPGRDYELDRLAGLPSLGPSGRCGPASHQRRNDPEPVAHGDGVLRRRMMADRRDRFGKMQPVFHKALASVRRG